jgi:hypothetical protein
MCKKDLRFSQPWLCIVLSSGIYRRVDYMALSPENETFQKVYVRSIFTEVQEINIKNYISIFPCTGCVPLAYF